MYNPHMISRQQSLLIVIVGVISLSLGVLFNLRNATPVDPRVDMPELLWPQSKQIMPFLLQDHNGNTFDLQRLKGQWSLMFFGYTHCPDVCPTTLQLLDQVVKPIPAAQKPRVILVSIDPERDNNRALKEYIEYFNPDFLAATGEAAQLAYFTHQIGILYIRDGEADDPDYLMDHSASILLIDPEAKLRGIFSGPHQVENIHDKYLKIRNYIEQQNETL